MHDMHRAFSVYYNHLKGLLKTDCQASPQVFNSLSLGYSLRIFTSHEVPGANETTMFLVLLLTFVGEGMTGERQAGSRKDGHFFGSFVLPRWEYTASFKATSNLGTVLPWAVADGFLHFSPQENFP